MQRLALICDRGAESIAAAEVQQLLKKEATVKSGYITIPDCTAEDALTLCYRSQAAARVLAIVDEGEIKKVTDIKKESLLEFDYAPFCKESFRVTCERHGEHQFQAHEVEESIGALLHDEKKLAVSLKQPDMVLYAFILDNTYLCGVDVAGRDLGKREYKVFHTRRSLRATIAFAAVMSAGFTKEMLLVDPFCTDGGIVIEAALAATGRSPQRFKKQFALRNMPWGAGAKKIMEQADATATEKAKILGFAPSVPGLKSSRANAKLAGVEKSLTLTKAEISWLDTKVEKESADLIITLPPTSGKSHPLKEVEKEQHDLFHRGTYALKKSGKILLVSEKRAELLNAAAQHEFTLEKEEEIFMGGMKLFFLKFGRKG